MDAESTRVTKEEVLAALEAVKPAVLGTANKVHLESRDGILTRIIIRRIITEPSKAGGGVEQSSP